MSLLTTTALAWKRSFNGLRSSGIHRMRESCSTTRLFATSVQTRDQVEYLVKLLNDPTLTENYAKDQHAPTPDAFLLPRFLLNYLKPMNLVPKEFVMGLLDLSIAHHSKMPNIIKVNHSSQEDSAFTVCGDTHGQYHDFCRIFHPSLAGFPSDDNRFLFNGDMTDRGAMGLEILLFLLSAQQCQPQTIHLLRGNHETFEMNKGFGFLQEVLIKYDKEVFAKFQELFMNLPLGAVLNDKVFVAHGGLGKRTVTMTIDDINQKVERKAFDTYDYDSAFTELLWSDPRERIVGLKSSSRGAGYQFGADITTSFLDHNGLELMIRSHECEDAGYRVFHGGKLLTVFSAPNYCGSVKNKGAVVRFAKAKGKLLDYEIRQFTEEKVGPHTFHSAQVRLEKLARQRFPQQ
eukprot:gene10150-11233_t